MPTLDDLKYRSGGSVERRRSSGIEFVRTKVAKGRRSPKILQSDFVTKLVLNVDVAMDRNQASMRHMTTSDILLPQYYWTNRYASDAGWMSASGSFRWGFVDLLEIVRCWDRSQNQMICNSS